MLKQLSLIIVPVIYLAFAGVVSYADVSLVNQYDPNGNLVSGDGKYYEYNDANQLAKVRENDQNGKVIAEYFYDFAGQRVKKAENGVTTYSIGKHYETNVVAGKAENTSYFFANGERVAKKVLAADGTLLNTSFYHPDHLGGVNAVTNAAGTVVAKTSYLPFGEVRQGGQEKFSYTGKEKDKATDLYYFDARFNSPELRHFTQADSADADLSDPQDLNRYAYVGNNPLSYVDPDGHKKKKKAKLSKREKWMIEHGVDPDHDKTSLKSAKKQEKAGEKYNVAAKNAAPSASGGPIGAGISSGGEGASGGNSPELVSAGISNKGRALVSTTQTNDEDEAPSKRAIHFNYKFDPTESALDVIAAELIPYGSVAVVAGVITYEFSFHASYYLFDNYFPAYHSFVNSIEAYKRSH